ncbi:MAG TPA: glutathione S-transferase N-terminal domain-containing protein [Afifellaceae bacterium]|nr:glutathione S-transferase N-terminal domain-containing protein [Afifellaceae bacterium]
MSMKLYDLCGRNSAIRFSPYCWRAKMALMQKGLEFETVPTTYAAIAGIGEGAKSVPVLDDGGRVVSDSFDIAVYLDAAYPDTPVLFGHDGLVAAARLVEGWTIAALHPVVMGMIIKDIHDVLDDPDQAYFRQTREARFGKALEEVHKGVDALAEQLAQALAPVRHTLAHHAFIGGAKPLFTDYIVLGPLLWLRTIHGSVPFADDDPVGGWFERCLALHDGYALKAETAA